MRVRQGDLPRVLFRTKGAKLRYLFLLCLTLLSACAPRQSGFTGAEEPLLYDAAAVERADKIAIFIPGALASVRIFTPVLD